ncbi:alpha/beta fold hydrolase [Paenibacillus puerhi]|uniref:alpha/beta fold hydrolase n=1 Tax=Paenibacillus puerhi TaxID=2692622 RepID=UPI0013597994|nr:alpha/beta fold hydrolase [Paenibacillus puerhi]
MRHSRMNKRRIRWWIPASVLLLGALVAAGCLYLMPYKPDERAIAALHSGGSLKTVEQPGWIGFIPERRTEPSVLFYPGGLVQAESYAPLARALAWSGHAVYIIRMPLNLAVLGGDRALPVIDSEPDASFVIGGHSLGGVMASRFAVSHPDRIKGVYFLGSYPDPKGALADVDMPVLSVTGSLDGVLNRDKYEKARSLLPASAQHVKIEGGNHSQFGSYGLQKGDQPASITPDEQQQRIVQELEAWLQQIK